MVAMIARWRGVLLAALFPPVSNRGGHYSVAKVLMAAQPKQCGAGANPVPLVYPAALQVQLQTPTGS